jgi:hypothetical protein
MAGGGGEVGAYTAAPTNYGNLVTANSGTVGATSANVFVGGASRQISASSSDDAGVFTHGAHVGGWAAFALAIRPAGAASWNGAVVMPVTFGAVTAGIAKHLAQVVSPFTVGLVTQGIAKHLAQVVTPITFGAVVNGVIETKPEQFSQLPFQPYSRRY